VDSLSREVQLTFAMTARRDILGLKMPVRAVTSAQKDGFKIAHAQPSALNVFLENMPGIEVLQFASTAVQALTLRIFSRASV
jgi:hypothetical protein